MLKPPKVKFKQRKEESLLAFIKNSVGSTMFRTYYVEKDGKVFDVLRNGELSCAVYVSSLLVLAGQMKDAKATVARTVETLLRRGARKIPVSRLRPGDIIVWAPKASRSGAHNHLGFYVGQKKAVSNSTETRKIALHSYNYNGKRKIEFALRLNWK